MFFKLLVNSTNHVDINRTSTTHLTHHQITMEFPSLLLSLQILIPTLIFLTLILTKKRAPKLPPGPRRIPVLGNMHNMISGEAPHRLLHKLSQKFGPVMHLQLGEVSVAVISSPEAAKQVMKTHDIHFASRSPIIVAEIISYGCTSITFSPYGEYWRQLRKITTLELLSMKRVQSFRWLREKVFVDLARKFAGAGAEVNFSKKFNAATFGLISRAALGDGTKQVESLHPMINELAELSAGFDIADVFPSVKLFQWMSRLKKRVLVIHKDIDRILEEVIHQHRIANNDEHHEDILDVLLKYQQDGLDFSLTKDNVKSVIVDLDMEDGFGLTARRLKQLYLVSGQLQLLIVTSAPYGHYWRHLRKICTLELLSAKRVHSFRSLRERVFLDLALRIASNEKSPINLTAELYASTYALISRATLGERAKEHEALIPILEEVMECAAGFYVAEFFPSIKFLQGVSGLRKRVGGLHREIDEILEDVIRQHRGVEADERGEH
ncbi:hypothetical protein SASPL_130424 [Salvia splendens]|uniref:Cytochrome P450 n=1 Tax=Salvia splendens TaxID=180675 RepID=A0A8X8X847_SALSN|nr:hypothetical protein SASPL_130424 [Salvia splendens]